MTAYVNGVEAAGTLAGGVFTFATAPAAGSYVTFHARTELPAESFALPQVALDSDADVVHAEQSTLPLVIFGGQDADKLYGGSAADVLLGDRGRVLYLDDALPLPGTGVEGASLDALEAAARTVLGHGGPLDRTDGLTRGVSVVVSVDPAVGGADIITGGEGDDVILGGLAGDVIDAGEGFNVVLGDSGGITAGFRPAYAGLRLAPLPGILGTITTTAPSLGGDDVIDTGSGKDVVLGGMGGDTIRSGAGNDLVLGDNGQLIYADDRVLVSGAPESRLRFVRSSDHFDGGRDRIEGGEGEDVLVGGSAGDSIDGDTGDDLILGDQVSLERRVGDTTSLRFQSLGGALLYGLSGDQLALLDGLARTYRDSDLTAPDWALYRVLELWHSATIAGAGVPAGKVQTFGDDYVTGGAGDDLILGELGNDVLLGDGALEDGPASALRIASGGDPLGALLLAASLERLTDGDDYIEGGGGDDTLFGGLGQDDLIGGSSSLFSLVTPGQRPDGNDYIFGGSGTRTAINSATGDLTGPRSADADAIVGDNGDIVRVVGTDHGDSGYAAYGHDDSGRKIVVRAVTLLDAGTGADEVHGESGDDVVYGGGGNDRLFGDAENDDLIGGLGHDWISGGTGQDGILGDEGRIRTYVAGVAEPLYGNPALPGTAGVLVKSAAPGSSLAGGDDVLFGGLGDDVLYGGAGDDAISGAEALLLGYAADVVAGGITGIVRSDFLRPYNPGGLLHYGLHRAGQTLATFALYDASHPNTKIMVAGREFFLNNDQTSGPKLPVVPSDGDDQVIGAAGNDWLVGGTGRDNLSGGDGDDLLNADDDLTTGGGTNLFADNEPSYADQLTGGNGRDVFLTNGEQDHKVDPDGDYSGGTPNQGGVPLPVTGGTGPISSTPKAPGIGNGLNPLLDKDKRQLTKKQKAKKKKAAAKKRKAKKKAKKKKAKKKKQKAKKKKAKKKGKGNR